MTSKISGALRDAGVGVVACARQHFFFERIRHVAAGIVVHAHAAHDRNTVAARHLNGDVTAVDAGLAQEAAMQVRTAAVRDRIADDRQLHDRRSGSISRSKYRNIRVIAKSLASIGSVRIV